MLVLLGAVGAGKGTQAPIIARERGLLHLATGDLFRRALRDGTPLGEVGRGYMRRGELVPDEITIRMVAEVLAGPSARAGVVFDGFPRTVAQAEALDRLLKECGRSLASVLLLDVPRDELLVRLGARATCSRCPSWSA